MTTTIAYTDVAGLAGTDLGYTDWVVITQQQVEARVAGCVGLELAQVLTRRQVAGQERRDQPTARGRAAPAAAELPEVGDDAEASPRVHCEPCASRQQVASPDHAGRVDPGIQRSGRPRVEFIAIGGHHQPMVCVAPPRED